MSPDIDNSRSQRKRQSRRRRRRRPRVVINWGRLLLSIAIAVTAIALFNQLVAACRSCTSSHSTATSGTAVGNCATEKIDSAKALGAGHAAQFKALSPDTAAMCDYLLEVRARATNFENRFGPAVSEAYTTSFEKSAGL